MSLQDPIADLLTRVRNAQAAKHRDVSMPHSKLKAALCGVLEQEGYIAGYDVSGEGNRELNVRLRYHDGAPVIEQIRRVSRPGLRIYKGAADLPKVRGGLGVAIVSTSNGLMTDREARRQRIGGEVLCTVF